MSKLKSIVDTYTGEVFTDVAMSGQRYLNGRLAVYNGKIVNGFKEYIPEEPAAKADEKYFLAISDDLMYEKPGMIQSMNERDKILEFCERMNIHNIIDTNASNGEIIRKIMELRSIVKKQRMVVR